jgi:hypothetical protein
VFNNGGNMPRLIAVDLGSHSVKVTVMQTGGKQTDVEGRFVEQVPVEGEALPTIAARVATLNTMVNQHPEWRSTGNTVAIAWADATTRTVSLPFVSKSDIDESLFFEVESLVPFDLDEMTMGYKVLNEDDGAELMVSLVETRALESLISEMAAIQLNPKHVWGDGDVLAAYRRPGEVVAVVNVGHSQTTVSIVQNATTMSCRSIDIGGRDFGKDPTPLPIGLADFYAAPASVAKSAMVRLMADIRVTVMAAEDGLSLDVDSMCVVGGSTRSVPVKTLLSQEFQLPNRTPTTWGGEDLTVPFGLSDAVAMVALGETDGSEIELRSGVLAYRGGFDPLRASIYYVGGFTLLSLFAMVVFYIYQSVLLTSQIDTGQQRIGAIVSETLPELGLGDSIDTARAKAIMSEELARARTQAAVLGEEGAEPVTVARLAALSNAFPSATDVTVDVTDLTITPDSVNFTAETDSYASADAVAASLSQSAPFSAATKGNEKKVRDKISFPVSIPLQAVEEVE